MRVYISIDMEGVAGVATLDQVGRGGHGYPRAQELMTAEANAAIAGAFDGGADSVVVNDSHGTMDNLIHEQLDPRARLVFGSPKAECMAEGLSADMDAALFIGYHAPAGVRGVLAHTFSAHFTEVRINGERASETSVNALLAAAHGVPVAMVSGDDVICGIAAELLEDVVTVPVKVAHGWSAADSLPPGAAREAIAAGAREAVRRAAGLRALHLPTALEIEIDMPNQIAAELAAMMPGVTRRDDRTVVAAVADPATAIGVITVGYELANASLQKLAVLLNRR
ncbi:MAG: M55 family metallopeptidase [Microbacteriaceae bacterium]